MPSFDEHCKFTYDRYGVTGEEIHEWMDEPVKLFGPSHRKIRHDPNQKIPQKFIEIYGAELSRNIVLDHILKDLETEQGVNILTDGVGTQKIIQELKDKIRLLETEQAPNTPSNNLDEESAEVVLNIIHILHQNLLKMSNSFKLIKKEFNEKTFKSEHEETMALIEISSKRRDLLFDYVDNEISTINKLISLYENGRQ